MSIVAKSLSKPNIVDNFMGELGKEAVVEFHLVFPDAKTLPFSARAIAKMAFIRGYQTGYCMQIDIPLSKTA